MAVIAVAMALLAASAAPETVASAEVAPPELTNRTEIVSKTDIPTRLVRAGKTLSVTFLLSVDRQGKVTQCEVYDGSGEAELDALACRLYSSRARFRPARDVVGAPIESDLSRTLHVDFTSEGPRPADHSAPSGRIAGLLREGDYPDDAIDKEEEGTVHALLSVDADGRATGCRVAISSGSTSLDAQTCKLLTERMRLQPATNPYGHPVPGTVRQRVTWKLEPDTPKPVHVWADRMIFESRPDGQFQCRREWEGTDRESADCSAEVSRQKQFLAAALADGPSSLTLETRFIPHAANDDLLALPKDQLVLSRIIVEFNVGADGTAHDCRLVQSIGFGPSLQQLCKIAEGPYAPPANRESIVPFTGTLILSATKVSLTR